MPHNPTTAIVIPARLESTRLPRKLLLDRTGLPLIQHTWIAASCSQLAAEVIVATDHEEIRDVVEAFGGQAVLTRSDHVSGTDRLAEVARQKPDIGIWVNVQGDEPEIDPDHIDLAIRLLQDDETADMATLASPLDSSAALADPACVKLVCDAVGRALYFSRSPIPWPGKAPAAGSDEFRQLFFRHIGLYVYRRPVLLELTAAPRSPAEQAESLEQLRALHLGKTIRVGVVDGAAGGIDTPQDYEAFVSRFAS